MLMHQSFSRTRIRHIALIKLDIDKADTWRYARSAFTDRQDRAPLESDPSGLWGFAKGAAPNSVASLFYLAEGKRDRSFWKTNAVNSGGLGAGPQGLSLSHHD